MDNCKICGTEMVNFEGIDSQYDEQEQWERITAYCPHCKKRYAWWEVFVFDRIEDYEEDND